jgi:bifunctional non-homologous end joining protein LigD
MDRQDQQPLPVRVQAMLATPGPPPPADGRWAVEMKWDGVRALAFIEGGRVRLVSRTGRDITVAYPELAGLGSVSKHGGGGHGASENRGSEDGAGEDGAGENGTSGHWQLLLDGEIVAFGDGGWPEFEALQPRIHASTPAQAALLAAETPVTYLVFDLLQLDGRPLLDVPYRERRELLDQLALSGPYWQTPPSFPGADFQAVLAASVANGLEGVVAKLLDSRYEPGSRSGSWRKIKNVLRQEVIVAGWKPGKGNRFGQIGSLLIGLNSPEGLSYAGHVGTGFTVETLRMLGERLAPLRRLDSPFEGPVPEEHARTAVWVEPRLVIDVAFGSWTRAGRMRAPTYKGLRDDKEPADVVRET